MCLGLSIIVLLIIFHKNTGQHQSKHHNNCFQLNFQALDKWEARLRHVIYRSIQIKINLPLFFQYNFSFIILQVHRLIFFLFPCFWHTFIRFCETKTNILQFTMKMDIIIFFLILGTPCDLWDCKICLLN